LIGHARMVDVVNGGGKQGGKDLQRSEDALKSDLFTFVVYFFALTSKAGEFKSTFMEYMTSAACNELW